MNINKKLLVSLASLALIFVGTANAHAATPTLSLSGTGGDSVQVTVTADPNATVFFYYNVASSGGMQTRTLGTTNSSGWFATTVSTSGFGVNQGSLVYVIVNAQQSPTQTWPSNSGCSGLLLNQTNVTLFPGQSSIVYSCNNTYPLYVASNSNPSVATFTVNNNQLTIVGNSVGYTSASVCAQSGSSNCATVTVSVTQSGNYQNLYLSQSTIYLSGGQSATVSVTGGTGSYYISTNSNQSAVQVGINGSTISLYGMGPAGTATITICSGSGAYCATLTVYAGNNNSGSVTFSQNSVSIPVNTNQTVSIYGSGAYSLSSNSNPNIVNATLSGSTLNLQALSSPGNATITICQSSGGCGTVYVSVTGIGGGTGNQIFFTPTNPTVAVGQTVTVSLSGGYGNYYISNSTNPMIQTTINGNTLTIYGASAGSTSVTICSSGDGCGTLYVTVGGSGSYYPYYSSTYDTSSLLAQIQALKNQLAQLEAQARNQTGLGYGYVYNNGITTNSYVFINFLTLGSYGEEVTQLQQRLTQEGTYAGPITGYFGYMTQQAVRSYQSMHGLSPVGSVGPQTRALLNGGYSHNY